MRLLLLGLDALDPEFLQECDTPCLDQWAQDGHYARIESTDPALTAVAWPSAVTGVDCAQRASFDKDGNHLIPTDIWKGAFWEQCDWPVGIVNVPYTLGTKIEPPEGSFVIQGLMPSPRNGFKNVPAELRGAWPIDRLGWGKGWFPDRNMQQMILEGGEKTMVELLIEHAPSVEILFVGFMSADYVGHFHYGKDEMRRMYKSLDDCCGRLASHYEPERVIVFSDHGMMPIDECEERDFRQKWVDAGKARGHTGGHRRDGVFIEYPCDEYALDKFLGEDRQPPIERLWDVYHRITADWGDSLTPFEEEAIDERCRALGYID